MLLRCLQRIIPRDGANPKARLVRPCMVDCRLQHAELALVEQLITDAFGWQVEDLTKVFGLLLTHVLCRNRALVLGIVQDHNDRNRALHVHHGHGRVEIWAMIHVGLNPVNEARDSLVPHRVELQSPLAGLRRRVDIAAVPEHLVVHDVKSHGRGSKLLFVVFRVWIGLYPRPLVLVHCTSYRLVADHGSDRILFGHKMVRFSGHARVDAN
mmetsp:Transcript_80282/g.201997  ORF Transcript_80282/g.201997 Transcript_80282/m.201997 type:complete len:211 (-) Transcript_80282:847-1479(-)